MKNLFTSILCAALVLMPFTGYTAADIHDPLQRARRTVTPSITTQGTTSTPSVVQLEFKDSHGVRITSPVFARIRVCNSGGYANATNATIQAITTADTDIASTGGCTTVETHTSTKDITVKSAVAAQATGTLTISSTVIDGETVTLGTRVYEFDSHTTSTITSGNVRVPIDHASASTTVAAQGILTLATQPTAGDLMTIGIQTYVWVASGTADAPGEISVGANLAAAKVNFVAAVNGTDGFNTANTKASAATFSSNTSTLTALAGGATPTVATTSVFTSGSNLFNAATLGTTTTGVSCSAAQAGAALVTAINADASRVVTASGTTTVTVTAVDYGTTPNAYASTETMANGAFGATTLNGGTTSTPGIIKLELTNATAESVTLRVGPPLLTPIDTDWNVTQTVVHAAP